jgi:hypothetical protein
MVRLSVSVWPPPDVVAVLAGLDRPALAGVRWSGAEQWLVKVRPLGHVAERLVEPLVEALEAELDGAPAVECTLGPATRRLGGQWLGAPVRGLEELAEAVFAATAVLVPVTHPQPFWADLVLARGRVGAEGAGRAGAVGVVDGQVRVAGGRPLGARGGPLRGPGRGPPDRACHRAGVASRAHEPAIPHPRHT